MSCTESVRKCVQPVLGDGPETGSALGESPSRSPDAVARRTAEGKSKREIIRCLKRYIAREVYAALKNI